MMSATGARYAAATGLQSNSDFRRSMTRLRLIPRWVKGFRKRYIRLVHGDDHFIADYFDARFLVNRKEFVAREIALKTFERLQLDHLIAICAREKPDIFLDIGAHGGLYSCILLKRNLVSRALLFEPDPKNVVLLRANLLINGLEARADVREIAVSRAPGRMWLESGPAGNTGLSRLGAGGGGREVQLVALDDVLDISGARLAIKIDIEGHELEALAGMRRVLERNSGVVQIETRETRPQVIGTMNALGYIQIADFYHDLVFLKDQGSAVGSL